jgi:hypothetical protein
MQSLQSCSNSVPGCTTTARRRARPGQPPASSGQPFICIRARAQGKCTPLRFDWKASAVNVGKLMRYEVVKELQAAGDDVHVECTGDPAELKEITMKAEVCMR